MDSMVEVSIAAYRKNSLRGGVTMLEQLCFWCHAVNHAGGFTACNRHAKEAGPIIIKGFSARPCSNSKDIYRPKDYRGPTLSEETVFRYGFAWEVLAGFDSYLLRVVNPLPAGLDVRGC